MFWNPTSPKPAGRCNVGSFLFSPSTSNNLPAGVRAPAKDPGSWVLLSLWPLADRHRYPHTLSHQCPAWPSCVFISSPFRSSDPRPARIEFVTDQSTIACPIIITAPKVIRSAFDEQESTCRISKSPASKRFQPMQAVICPTRMALHRVEPAVRSAKELVEPPLVTRLLPMFLSCIYWDVPTQDFREPLSRLASQTNKIALLSVGVELLT